MVRDRLAPALRAMGFRGSGQAYTLPSDTHWAMLGLQRDKWSDRNRLAFTVNVSVVSRSAWEQTRERVPWVGVRPSANGVEPVDYELQVRIGDLCGRGDYWWPVSADGSDEDSTLDDVLAVIEQYALPALRAALNGREHSSDAG